MIVEAKGLTKTFHRARSEPFTAVAGIDFTIAPGERVAFIGPNGAGKSTTLKMLTGILHPIGGAAQRRGLRAVARAPPARLRDRHVFGQRSQLWYQLRARDSSICSRIYGLDRATYRARLGALVERFEIGALLDAPVRQLSLGSGCAARSRQPAARARRCCSSTSRRSASTSRRRR